MATQEDKIREMANKKLLNGEQKKVLYKLFEQKINDRLSKARGGYANAEKELEEQELQAGLNNAEVKKQLAIRKQAEQSKANAEKAINKLGYSLDYHGELTLRYGDNAKLKKFNAEKNKTLAKMEDLKMKLLADIHGLPMTYAEMTAYINGELTKIENE